MNPSKLTCFAHHHMTPAEYGLYTHLREVSSKNNFLYTFDDRIISGRFAHKRGSSKDAVNRLRQSLAKLGFIEWTGPQRRSGGKFDAREGRILSHKEWAERHPGKCINSPVSNATSNQSHLIDHQSHLGLHQSRLEASPVSKQTPHQSRQRDISIHTQSGIVESQYPSGMAGPDSDELSPPPLDSANRESHLEAPVSPARQVTDSPVSPARQVVGATEIAARFGLKLIDGEWFTGEGTKVHPNALAILLKNEGEL